MSAPTKSRSLASNFAASKSALAVPVSDCERGLRLTASFSTACANAEGEPRRSGVASAAQPSMTTAHLLRAPLSAWLIPSSPCSARDSQAGWAGTAVPKELAERAARFADGRESARDAPLQPHHRLLWVT